MKYILLVEDNVSFAGKFARLLEAFPGLEIEVVTGDRSPRLVSA